jgi:outer membrane immunogenic protein
MLAGWRRKRVADITAPRGFLNFSTVPGKGSALAATGIRRLTLAALSIAGAIGVAAPSFAAGGFGSPPYNWTGFYLGAQVGAGRAKDDIRDESLNLPGFSDYSDQFHMNGATGGIYGGYNHQSGLWLVGVEADAELADVNGTNPNWPFGDETRAKIRAQGSLRGRVGYLIYHHSLLYVTGGFAFADIKTEYVDGSNLDSYSHNRTGWALGAGFEHVFSPNWVGRIEYRYADFGHVTDVATTTDPGWQYHNDFSEQALRIGIAYKF